MQSSSEQELSPEPVLRDRYGYRVKACAICGREFGKRWRYHWRTQHNNEEPREHVGTGFSENPLFRVKDRRFKKGVVPDSGRKFWQSKFDDKRIEKDDPLRSRMNSQLFLRACKLKTYPTSPASRQAYAHKSTTTSTLTSIVRRQAKLIVMNC